MLQNARPLFGCWAGTIGAIAFVGNALVIVFTVLLNTGAQAYSSPEDVSWKQWIPTGQFVPYLLVPYVGFVVAIARSNTVGDSIGHAIREAMARDDGHGSLKLVALETWRPCGLTLFGRRVSAVDIIVSIASAVALNIGSISRNS